MPILSQRLTLLRENQGWSKAETARRLGLKAPSTYGNWEYGIREPDLQMVANIAELYDVSVDYLIGQDDETDAQGNVLNVDIQLERLCMDLKGSSLLKLNGQDLAPEIATFMRESLLFVLEQAKTLNEK
ncbi:helix-turn-helix domain-containing protein [Listeria grayi]|uniref:DNA-binding helix-turn-helix protein n=2 Tax=Listeria grayi TaxID=1641 RepID=D7UYH4_LISGR|nr:helix-turn-helix transcriptional regulator [Listeria grayi]EFI83391.1 DNA-binding helix-turn-helix protein [Listeria grayi DSM 20601]STY43575.1 HTH-type transcriptional regulator immR [Listeria grayi]